MKKLAAIALFVALSTCAARAVGNHSAVLAWQPVSTYTNGQPLAATVCYVVYKSSDGVSFVKTATDIALTTSSWVDTNVIAGETYYYRVTVYDSAHATESAVSNIVKAVIP